MLDRVVNYPLVNQINFLHSKKFGITISAILYEFLPFFMNFCKSFHIINIQFFITVLPPK